MTSIPVKLILSAVGVAFVLIAASPTDAAPVRKHKAHATAQAKVASNTAYRGTNLFPAGPIYHANEYLGDDPDPFIRLMILRDLGAHYGGND